MARRARRRFTQGLDFRKWRVRCEWLDVVTDWSVLVGPELAWGGLLSVAVPVVFVAFGGWVTQIPGPHQRSELGILSLTACKARSVQTTVPLRAVIYGARPYPVALAFLSPASVPCRLDTPNCISVSGAGHAGDGNSEHVGLLLNLESIRSGRIPWTCLTDRMRPMVGD